MPNKFLNNRGNILLIAIVFGFISFSVVVVAVTSYAISENRASVKKHNREMAFQIAEAGVNYYRWHLAHNKNDFTDSTTTPGPYIHVYEDKDGNVVGRYSLNIIIPVAGSTVVTIESTGWLDVQPESKRTIRVRLGFPALTDYALLTAEDIWIGDNEATHGKLHANGGIRFDGTGDAPITSAVPTYICKAHHGCGNQEKPGIWGDGGPTNYWSFPVPSKSFVSITAKLKDVKDAAVPPNGLYLTSSGKQGWRISFQTDGTYKVYKVNTTDCYDGKDIGDNRYHTYCIDAKTFGDATTYTMSPTNSTFIYSEDNTWVDGTVNGRATVGVAIGKSIIINGNILYAAKDGTSVLGLMAEQNVLLPYNSPNILEVDAALIAQNGAVKRYYYPGNKKDQLTIYGSIISNGIWTWSWVSGGGAITSGYLESDTTYDANLSYGPPPAFPVGSEYNLISWELVD